MPRFDPATPLVHPLPGPERAEVRPGLVYAEADGRELAMDLYLPSGPAPVSPVPAVLLVHGEANPAMLRGVRSWGQYTGWGRLLAAEGLAGVVAEHRAVAEAGFEAVVAEVAVALTAVHDRAAELGVDPDRLAVAAFSAGVPLTAATISRVPVPLRCAALCYGPPATSSPAPACRRSCWSGPGRTTPTSTRASTSSAPPPRPPACPSSWSTCPTATTPSTRSTTPTPPATPSAGSCRSSAGT
jgi:acetyl esterase/lipase